MNQDLRVAAKACLVYSGFVAFFAWQAFFAHAPNDAGALVVVSALPMTWLASSLWHLQEPLASALHLSVSARFAISFDAVAGWILGCLQYGILAFAVSRFTRFWRWSNADGA